jgi:phosphoglycerate kinase
VVVLGGPADPERVRGIERLMDFVDMVVLGGPIAYASMTPGTASDEIMGSLRRLGSAGHVVIPPDVLVTRIDDPGQVQIASSIPTGWRAVDIGHRSSTRFATIVAGAGTVFWDGAMSGDDFIRGTRTIAEAVAYSPAFTVVSGAETMEALDRLRLSAFIDHASTGGAASLEFLHDGDLPGLRALVEAETG